MPTKALEIDLRILMGGPHADGCVAQLVQIPPRRIVFPQRVGLAIRETSIPIRRQVGAPRKAGLALCHKHRSRCRTPTRRQILVQQCSDGARKKHLTWAVAFALDENGAIRPGNILNVDGQGFLATQTAIIDQPEEGAVAWVGDLTQERLDALCIERSGILLSLRFPLYLLQDLLNLPPLSAEPPDEAAQGGQAPIVGGGRERFLARKKRLYNLNCKRGNGCLTARCEQWCQILGITFACASGKRGAFEELLERASQSHDWQRITSFYAISHLMRMDSLCICDSVYCFRHKTARYRT